MSNELMIELELGEDVDLLLEPDEWLDNHRLSIQQRMAMMADELDRILAAQRIKEELQQTNMVAVRHIERNEEGEPDTSICICPLPAALDILENDCKDPEIPSSISSMNAHQQMKVWQQDGYDVKGSNDLRRTKHGKNSF